MILYQHLIRLILASIFAIGLMMNLQWTEGYWMLLSALLALQWCPSVWWWQQALLLLAAAISTLFIVWLITIEPQAILVLAWSLFVITIVLVYLGLRFAQFTGLFFLMNVLIVLAVGLPISHELIGQRVVAMGIGFTIAFLLRLVIFPARLKSARRRSLEVGLQALLRLNQAIFLCLISVDYPKRTYYYEKQLHKKRANFLFAMSNARRIVAKVVDPMFTSAVTEIEHIYEIILSLSRLMHRVGDYTTLQVVNAELTALAAAIDHHLRAMVTLLKVPSRLTQMDEAFAAAIFQLEEVHRSALQVVAPEPIVFLFFQQDLNALNEALIRLDELLQQWVNR